MSKIKRNRKYYYNGLSEQDMFKNNVIYCMTFPNGKMYVGLTTTTLESRLRKHITSSKRREFAIHNAINKYGIDNIKFSILDESDDLDELKEKEIYWIKKLNTFTYDKNNNGYNSTLGGDGVFGKIGELNHKAKTTEEDVIKIRYDFLKGMTQTEIANKYNITPTSANSIKFYKTWKHVIPELKEKLTSMKAPTIRYDLEKVIGIKTDLYNGMRCVDVCKKYNIGRKVTQSIKNLESYADILPEYNKKLNSSKKISNTLNSDEIILIKTMLYDGIDLDEICDWFNFKKFVVKDIAYLNTYKNVLNEYNEVLSKSYTKKRTTLTTSNVEDIKKDLFDGLNINNVATKYNLSKETIRNIAYLKYYKNISEELNSVIVKNSIENRSEMWRKTYANSK